MTRIAHALTLAAMGATAGALAIWVPYWWLGALVAVVLDGAWWTAAQYERRMKAAGADATVVTRLTWGIAALSAALLVVHALDEQSLAWGALAVLPLVSRALTWVHGLWEATELTDSALETIRVHHQEQRDAVAIDRARLRSETDAECVRLAEISTAAQSLARERAAALDRMEQARELTDRSRSLATVPDGWSLTRDTPAVEASPAPALNPAPTVKTQVICGGHLPVPPVPPRPKLGTEEARLVIEAGWRDGRSIRDTARDATRSASQVQRVFARLDAEQGEVIPGQTEIPVAA